MIKISIIIPVYNKERFLDKCIQSVLDSPLKEFEIICIEDGSTDGSKELLQEIQKDNSSITVFTNEKNRGAAYSRNIGITHAKGKYIMFLDADDYLDTNALEIYYENNGKSPRRRDALSDSRSAAITQAMKRGSYMNIKMYTGVWTY